MLARPLRVTATYSLWVSGLLLLTGCSGPQKRPLSLTPVSPGPMSQELPAERAGVWVAGTPGPARVSEEMAASVQDPVQSAPSMAAGPPVEGGLQLPSGVLPLPIWFHLCGFSDARVTRNTHPQRVELRTGAGVLALTLGQRYAQWNGINIALGFAPVMLDGQMALHSLDVDKNIYPLAARSMDWQTPTRVLVVDAGHGGPNSGARVAGRNVFEKDLTLDWALRIEKLLENSAWKVVLTRRDDRDLSLGERVAIADAHDADLFISLHFNAAASGNAPGEGGVETYCLTPTGMPSNIAREGFEDDPSKVYPNNAFDLENLLLAARLHDSLVKSTARPDRGVRRARFMTVLREQNRPAVLLEGGFLSNPAEAELILQPAFRQQLAEAVCEALPN